MNYESEITRTNLSAYITGLLAAGRLVFSRDEAQTAIGTGRGAFLAAAQKLQKRGRLLNPRQGFYVIVPPQNLNFASPPPASFLDDLLCHEKRLYYVGLLKAAELHGSAPHALMQFQILPDNHIRNT